MRSRPAISRRVVVASFALSFIAAQASCRKGAPRTPPETCEGVLRDCDGQIATGCETRIGTAAHCGDCNQRCADGQACVGASCQPAGDLAMASEHTCVLDASGHVRCWGANRNGELGDGTRTLRERPVHVAGIDDAVQLVVRARQSCVRRRSGAVFCWGNAFGTGNPGTTQLVPTEVAALRDVTDLALADFVLCGLKPSGAIVCIPSASNDKAVPVVGPPPGEPVTDAVDLVATPKQLWAARRDGTLIAWNMDPFDDPAPPTRRQAQVENVQNAVSLTSGGETVCAFRSNGRATCVGGDIVTTSGAIRPTMVGGPHDFGSVGPVTDLAFLGWPSREDCATQVTGETFCWEPPRIAPKADRFDVVTRLMKVPPAHRIEAASSRAHCVLTRTGDVYCWGDPAFGRLGVGRSPEQPSPQAIEGVTGVREVVASDQRACARTASGSIVCWGAGKPPHPVAAQGVERLLTGRCASVRGELVCFDEPFVESLPASSLRDVVQLVPAARGTHVLSYFARHSGGTVSRIDWERTNTSTPVWSRTFVGRLKGLTGVKELLVADDWTCARDGTRTLRCWSSLAKPPDADGPLEVALQTVAVPAGFEQVHVTRMFDSGAFDACGVRGGKIGCWNDRSAEPQWIALSDVRRFEISPGNMMCADIADGSLSCWGARTMTGNGSIDGAVLPERVPGLNGVAGWSFTQKSYGTQDAVYVWQRDGRLLAWGHNGSGEPSRTGQLGWISPPVIEEPTKVVGP
jgi:hypothetical protein